MLETMDAVFVYYTAKETPVRVSSDTHLSFGVFLIKFGEV